MKDCAQLVGIDPDTGVCDFESKYDVWTQGFELRDANGNFADLCKFEGISNEIEQNLAHPNWVTPNDCRDRVLNSSNQLEPLGLRLRRQHVQYVVNHGLHTEVGPLNVHLPGLKLRVVEDSIDD